MRARRALARLCGRDARAPRRKPTPVSPRPAKVGAAGERGVGEGVSRKRLSSVINGRAGVSPEMAIRLDKAFGGGAATWRNLQAAYDPQRDGQDK